MQKKKKMQAIRLKLSMHNGLSLLRKFPHTPNEQKNPSKFDKKQERTISGDFQRLVQRSLQAHPYS